MAEITMSVNGLAVIVGAVVAFALGWLWYSPMLFGTIVSGRCWSLDGRRLRPACSDYAIATEAGFILAMTVVMIVVQGIF